MPTRTSSTALIPLILLGVLALVSAVEPLSINMYLSGLPQLGRDLDLTQSGAPGSSSLPASFKGWQEEPQLSWHVQSLPM